MLADVLRDVWGQGWEHMLCHDLSPYLRATRAEAGTKGAPRRKENIDRMKKSITARPASASRKPSNTKKSVI